MMSAAPEDACGQRALRVFFAFLGALFFATAFFRTGLRTGLAAFFFGAFAASVFRASTALDFRASKTSPGFSMALSPLATIVPSAEPTVRATVFSNPSGSALTFVALAEPDRVGLGFMRTLPAPEIWRASAMIPEVRRQLQKSLEGNLLVPFAPARDAVISISEGGNPLRKRRRWLCGWLLRFAPFVGHLLDHADLKLLGAINRPSSGQRKFGFVWLRFSLFSGLFY
jgi:hypothetical protein